MSRIQDDLDIEELGVASELTQGMGLVGAEPVGFQRNTGISDLD